VPPGGAQLKNAIVPHPGAKTIPIIIPHIGGQISIFGFTRIVGVSRNTGIMTLTKAESTRLIWLLLLAGLLLVAGLVTPLITIKKFIYIRHSFSMVYGMYELMINGRIILFLIITSFSIVMPILKIIVLFKILTNGSEDRKVLKRYLHLMHEYGRWAMLDVMVVAIMVVTVKLGAVVSVQVHGGVYLFGASVLLIMIITHRVVRLTSP